MSLAIKQKATNIILWGCDMISHSSYRIGTKDGDNEIKKYLKFFECAKKIGVKIWRGANGSCFDQHLPLYDNLAQSLLSMKNHLDNQIFEEIKSAIEKDSQ
jgi:hypothetical protein